MISKEDWILRIAWPSWWALWSVPASLQGGRCIPNKRLSVNVSVLSSIEWSLGISSQISHALIALLLGSPGDMLNSVNSVGIYFVVWVLGGLLALVGGLCFSELARLEYMKADAHASIGFLSLFLLLFLLPISIFHCVISILSCYC